MKQAILEKQIGGLNDSLEKFHKKKLSRIDGVKNKIKALNNKKDKSQREQLDFEMQANAKISELKEEISKYALILTELISKRDNAMYDTKRAKDDKISLTTQIKRLKNEIFQYSIQIERIRKDNKVFSQGLIIKESEVKNRVSNLEKYSFLLEKKVLSLDEEVLCLDKIKDEKTGLEKEAKELNKKILRLQISNNNELIKLEKDRQQIEKDKEEIREERNVIKKANASLIKKEKALSKYEKSINKLLLSNKK